MTPFSKVKTWIKQGFYEKLPSSKSLRGALDLQQEVMDSMIREGLVGTVNCCDYFPVLPQLTESDEDLAKIPLGGLAIINDVIVYKSPEGTLGIISINF